MSVRSRPARAASVPAPADRRFRRARVRPSGLRSRYRAFLRSLRAVTVLAVCGTGAFVGLDALVRSDLLRLRHVEITGNERLASGDVVALLDGFIGRYLLAVDLEVVRGRLLTSPWVEDVELRRVLPSTLEVTIVEREPMGLARLRDRLFLVGEDGVIVDTYGPRYADLDLPVIDGLAPRDDGGPRVDRDRASNAALLIAALGEEPALLQRVSQIDVSDLYDVVVVLDGDEAALHLGEERFLERVRSYLDLRPTLRNRVSSIDYVDLRFDDRIYVRPVETTGRPAGGDPPPPAGELDETTGAWP